MWRTLAIGAVIAMVLASGAAASGPSSRVGCGRATPVDPSAPIGRAVPLGHVLWLGVYPFEAGYPTKTIVMAQRRIRRSVAIRGWNCRNGAPLRFWYHEGLPFARVPVTPADVRATGSLRASFGPWPAGAMRGGYLMFWRSGLWEVAAYQGGREIETAIVRAGAD